MIQILSMDTVQKIAAGEVIERPVSVVKELVENSIDAEASEIQVEIKKGGKELIRVQDNGSGIEKNDFKLAFQRHATSKISNFEDLYKVHSLGFRGEALASIIAVSKVRAQSKTESERTGLELYFEDSQLKERKNIAMPIGTQIQVEDLFYNVPVRKRFLKTDTTEANKISSLMYSLAIGNPHISFTYIKDQRLVFQTNKDQAFDENLLVLFGMQYYDALIPLDMNHQDYKIYGRLGNNTFYRSNRQMQFLYVNGRYVKDDGIRDIIENKYKSIIPNGRFPAFQIFIDTDPSNIDINIHPNKQKIKFFEFDQLEELLKNTVHESLLAQSRMPRPIEKEETTKQKGQVFKDFSDDMVYKEILKNYSWPKNTSEDLSDDFSIQIDSSKLFNENEGDESDNISQENSSGDTRDKANLASAFEFIEIEDEDEGSLYGQVSKKGKEFQAQLDLGKDLEEKKYQFLPDPKTLEYKTSIFSTYIIFERKDQEDLFLIDQHAAHERINYEAFMEDFSKGDIVSQHLLLPLYLDLTDWQMDSLEEKADILREIGFDFDLFGDQQVMVRAVPTLFDLPSTDDLFYAILDLDTEGLTNSSDLVDKIARKACKASVKQGDQLREEEIWGLYEKLEKTSYPLTCPHGRPTSIQISKTDIEKMFQRIK